MKTLLVLLSLSGFTYGLNFGIGDILPSRLQGNQCKDVCTYETACSFNGAPTADPCNSGSKRTNCCDYYSLR